MESKFKTTEDKAQKVALIHIPSAYYDILRKIELIDRTGMVKSDKIEKIIDVMNNPIASVNSSMRIKSEDKIKLINRVSTLQMKEEHQKQLALVLSALEHLESGKLNHATMSPSPMFEVKYV